MSHADPADEVDTPQPAPGVGGARLDIRDMTWRPYGQDTPVLSGVTLHAEPGERILLIGPSGSGKSTLLRAIAGVLTTVESGQLEGSISVDGRDPHEGGSSAGLLVQDPADAMVAGRVGREVAFGPENLGLSRKEIWQRVRESLDAVRFPHAFEHPVGAMSGGESQRLALAGVLALGPRLILLDEPTAMLDPVASAVVRNAICDVVADTAATIIIVEHHFDDWLDKIDRVIVLSAAGMVVADGPVTETLAAHSETLAALGVWIPEAPPPVPLRLSPELVIPFDGVGGHGTPAVVADMVTVNRAPRVGLTATDTLAPSVLASPVLSQINAIARAGEILAVVGASGAGKSTLAALLAGLSVPSSGTVHAGGVVGADSSAQLCNWKSRDLASRVGWVPQQAELAIVAQTVWDDAMSTCRTLDRDEQVAEARVTGLLTALKLADLRESDPHLLSGGELRRLALVGAIAHGPSVLVLDEPTVGQDRLTWTAVAGVITASRAAGLAVIVATHDAHLIELADRVIRLDHGRVVEGAHGAPSMVGTPPPVTTTAARPRRRLGLGLAARCGPLSLLGSSILLAIGALFITDVRIGAVALLVQAVLAPMVFGWIRPSARLLPGLLAVFSVGFSGWLLSTGQDMAVGITAGLRVAFFVLPGILMAGMIDPFALGDHLAQRLHFPPRPVVAAVAAMQRFDTLVDQWQQLARTRRIRGLAGGRSPVARIRTATALTFGLLLQSLRQAGRMAVAMESRGFSLPLASGVGRSWAEPAPWTAADSVLIGIGIVVAAIPAGLTLLAQVGN